MLPEDPDFPPELRALLRLHDAAGPTGSGLNPRLREILETRFAAKAAVKAAAKTAVGATPERGADAASAADADAGADAAAPARCRIHSLPNAFPGVPPRPTRAQMRAAIWRGDVAALPRALSALNGAPA